MTCAGEQENGKELRKCSNVIHQQKGQSTSCGTEESYESEKKVGLV